MTSSGQPSEALKLAAEVLEAEDDLALFEYFMEQGWGDGLPVIAPTEERVRRMFDFIDWSPEDSLGIFPPAGNNVTIEKLAINAVAAGCKPEYMPAIIAGTQAILEPKFNLNGVQATGNACTPLFIFAGPLVKQLGLNYSFNLFGPGNRANATIGRALSLIRVTLGGAIPGVVDKATHGHPGKYTYCIAENPDENPFEPHQVTMGQAADTTVVTAIAAEGPTRVAAKGTYGPRALLRTFADTMASLGTNKLYWLKGEYPVIFGSTHAEILNSHGFSKHDIQMFLFEKARRSNREMRGPYGGSGLDRRDSYPKWIDPDDLDQMIPVVMRPDDIVVIVAGGYTTSGAIISTWGAAEGVTKVVGDKQGDPIHRLDRRRGTPDAGAETQPAATDSV